MRRGRDPRTLASRLVAATAGTLRVSGSSCLSSTSLLPRPTTASRAQLIRGWLRSARQCADTAKIALPLSMVRVPLSRFLATLIVEQLAEVLTNVFQDRIQQRTLDTSVPQVAVVLVEVFTHFSRDRVQQRFAELIFQSLAISLAVKRATFARCCWMTVLIAERYLCFVVFGCSPAS